MALRSLRPEVQWRAWFVGGLAVGQPFVHTFSNLDGSPADCQIYSDEFVLAICQRNSEGTSTERIFGAGRYVYLEELKMWSGSSLDEIRAYENARPQIVLSANLNGQWLPDEIYRNALEWPYTDDDFPSMAPEGSFGIATKDRFDASKSRERAVRLGRASTLLDGI